MISEFFLNLAATFAVWVADLFPEWTPPTQLTDAASGMSSLLSTFSGIGAWVSFPVIGACVTAAVGTWAVVLVIKIIRAALAHVPAFGGAGD